MHARAGLGVRACDIAALYLQDRHFLDHGSDAAYAARRRDLLLVAVHCTAPAATCFCASTGDGPGVTDGLRPGPARELDDGFIVGLAGRGDALAEQLPLRPVPRSDSARRRRCHWTRPRGARPAACHRLAGSDPVRTAGTSALGRRGGRCLSCGNCTSVCPTCFCHRQATSPGLDGASSLHQRAAGIPASARAMPSCMAIAACAMIPAPATASG
jgi:sulfhydrogenase subunit beta (sulfur reductase)